MTQIDSPTYTRHNDSVYCSLTSFIDELRRYDSGHTELVEDKLIECQIWLDTVMYPCCQYGINVRPIKVIIRRHFQKTVLNMDSLIKPFMGIPYIRVNETKYRRLTREPSMIVIKGDVKKQYDNHEYYDYKIVKLFLRDELTQHELACRQAHEVIRSFIQQQNAVAEHEIDSLEAQRTLSNTVSDL